MKYCICDGTFHGVIEAENDQAALAEGRKWLAGVIEDTNNVGEWLLADGEEGEVEAGFCRLDTDEDDDDHWEVTVKIKMVNGLAVVVE